MDSSYYVVVNIQTPKGMLEVGKFFLGTGQSFAEDTFSAMDGSGNLRKYPSIRMDLVETKPGALPVCCKSIGCTLDQYAANCKILTRQVFKHFMFNEDLSV